MPATITLQDVSFSYCGELTLTDINLQIRENDFIAIIGPSGCGKSTLLRLISGLITPTRGKVLVGANPVIGPGLDRSVVFQDYSLFPWMSCHNNIVLALEQTNQRGGKSEHRRIVSKYLEMVGLAEEGHKLPGELSGGMRQRVAIARALAINAPILLMDEPFGALDAITRARQQEMLLDIWQSCKTACKTVIFVTHDVEEALLLANRVIVLGTGPGRIIRDLKIDLPQPRSLLKSLADPHFYQLRDTILEELSGALTRQLSSEVREGASI